MTADTMDDRKSAGSVFKACKDSKACTNTHDSKACNNTHANNDTHSNASHSAASPTSSLRSVLCGELRSDNVNDQVRLCGWVARRRDLGGFIFIDLRDKTGITQLALNPQDTDAAVFAAAEHVRPEWSLMVDGIVKPRPTDMVRDDMPTGAIEVHVTSLTVLNTSKTPPFHIEDDIDTAEDLRLRYRYLDLRRRPLMDNLKLRDSFTFALRNALHKHDFLEVETPILGKSTPEGARDFIVPSHLQKGSFYALPQSPQLFKQLLMIGGVDRYYQVARCFRDEDLRADRQPEFTQLDLEMSYVTQDDVMNMVETVMGEALKEVGITLPSPLRRLSYQEAMNTYGSDKPDTRFGMHLHDLSSVFTKTDFKVFSQVISRSGVVKALVAQDAASWGRSKIEKLTDVVAPYGAHGLAWLSYKEDGTIASSIAKFLAEDEIAQVKDITHAQPGDLVLIVADTPAVANTSLGALRLHIADLLNIPREGHDFLWVTDFPMFEYDEELGRYTAQHHPFTLPKVDDISELSTNPDTALSFTYDFVMDGCEAGGGGLRIYTEDMQRRVLHALGFSDEEAEQQFGFLLEALSFGAPPMGGFALGLDRVCMLIAGASSIRDVMAFPKTTSGSDLMLEAPSTVSHDQLSDVGIEQLTAASSPREQ